MNLKIEEIHPELVDGEEFVIVKCRIILNKKGLVHLLGMTDNFEFRAHLD